MSTTTQPLVPKLGAELNVVAIGRISTIHQDLENIEASYRYIQDFLARIYSGPIKLTLLGEQASGMLTDRATIRQAEDLVASGAVDLVIAEDLSRIYRNPRYQFAFVQNAVDIGTRVICIGDNLDTADENWEITMGAAALRHGLHIPDTRRRVRRTATHSFHKGGMVQKIRYGYRKLSAEEAASGQFGPRDLRIAKRPECTPILRELMQRILRGERYAALADWLNDQAIEPGAYVESRRWTGRLVVELLEDPILSGLRTFRDTICRPVFKTGRHKPVKNSEPETEFCAELAHFSSQEHAELCAAIAHRRAECVTMQHPARKRQGVPRSRSLWPGQSMTCGICGGLMYYAGRHFKCSNASKRRGARCWNHVQVAAQLARVRTVACLLGHLEPGGVHRQALLEIVGQMLDKTSGSQRRKQNDLAAEIIGLERQAAHLADAIAAGGELQTLIQRLKAVEDTLHNSRRKQSSQSDASQQDPSRLSKEQLDQRLEETLLELAGNSFEFADLLRKIVPRFVIEPVQALDTPLVRPRGKLTLCLNRLVSTTADAQPSTELTVELQLAVDLFEPPTHIRAIPACLVAKAAHPQFSLKRIGSLLGIHHMTVKRAFDYWRRMEQEGMREPYRELYDRPARVSRWN